MTKPQIWVAAFVLAFVVLFLLGRATKENYTMKNVPQMSTMPQSGNGGSTSAKDLSGEQLVSKLGCVNCHGTDLTGTKMAPDIHGVQKYWSRDALINYLRNPSSYMSSERFKAYRAKYPGIMMPPFNNIDVKDLGKVADYILTLHKK